jgi:hypothetical protein
VRDLIVEGRQVVRDGRLTRLKLGPVLERQRKLAERLAG